MKLWLVLVLWWGVYPLLPRMQASLWFVHLGVVVLAASLALPKLWRAPRVVAGVPLLCTALVLASVLVAARRESDLLPEAERWWAALTVCAHGLWFLVALALVPRHDPPADDPGRVRADDRDDVDGDRERADDRDDVDGGRERADGRDTAGGLPGESVESTRFRRGLAGVLGAILLLQTVDALSGLDGGGRLTSGLGNPNVFGACLAATALAFGACLRWHRVVPFTLLGVFVLLLATRSRGALAAVLLVVSGLVARRSVLALVLLLGALAAALVLVPNPLVERLLSMREEASYSRVFLWSTAAGLIPDNPGGLGPAMYKYAFPALALDPSAPWLVHQRHAVGLTHNAFLTLVVEGGWLAGAAGLLLVGWAGARLARRRGRDALGQAGLLGAAVLLLEAQVDAVEQNPLVFSLLLFLAALAVQRVPRPSAGLRLPGRWAALGLLVATGALAGLGLERLPGHLAHLRARATVLAWRQGGLPVEAAEQALLEARAALPGESAPARMLFDLRFGRLREAVMGGAPWAQQGQSLADAWAAIDAACRANPADPRLERARADLALMVLRRGGRVDQDFEAYRASAERVLELDPLDAVTRRELAQEAQRQGRPEVASAHLAELFRLEPDDAYAWLVTATLAERAGQREQALYAWIRAREAVYNARIKAAVDDPGAQAYFRDILARADLDLIRRRVAELRRELY